MAAKLNYYNTGTLCICTPSCNSSEEDQAHELTMLTRSAFVVGMVRILLKGGKTSRIDRYLIVIVNGTAVTKEATID